MEIHSQEQRVLGPVDFVVLRFPGNKFTGKIAPEIRRLQEAGTVRVIDLLFVRKDADGNVDSFEISDLGEIGNDFQGLAGTDRGWLSQDDVEAIGEELPNDSSAGAILFENVWAARLKGALKDAGAEVISQGRIPPEKIEMTLARSGPAGTRE